MKACIRVDSPLAFVYGDQLRVGDFGVTGSRANRKNRPHQSVVRFPIYEGGDEMPGETLVTFCHWILVQEPSAVVGRSPFLPEQGADTLLFEAGGVEDLRVISNDRILSSEKNCGRGLGAYAVYMSPFALMCDMHNLH